MNDNTHTTIEQMISQQEGFHITRRTDGEWVHFDYRSTPSTAPFLTKTLHCAQLDGLKPINVALLVVQTIGVKA